MSMNLIQIQDKLKSLPNDPRVTQLLTSYANGQNPRVPPYLALGELNRRKGEMERMKMEQAGQPPGGTVKDQIEQQAGVMALKQGQQQQAMQRMAQQGAMAGGPVPQGTPQPQVQAMAAGGLASLRPGYRSGGIIAFSEAGSVNDGLESDYESASRGEEGEEKEATLPTDPRELMALLMQQVAARQKTNPPSIESREDTEKRLIKENPERYGILSTPIGQNAVTRLDELQGNRRAELAKQREELAQSKPGILQLLGQAAMGSRGQKGGSALASILGGYSELASGADAKQLQQEQALRMKELDLQQAKAEAMNKVEEARRSQAEGNFEKARKEMEDAQKIAKDHNVSLNTLLGRQLTTASSLVESDRRSKDAEKDRQQRIQTAIDNQKAMDARANRPGEKERILRQIDRLRKDGKTEEAKQLLEDLRYLQGSAVGVNLARNERLIIEAQLKSANNVLTNSRSTPAEIAAAKVEIAELNKQLKGLRSKPDNKADDGNKDKEVTPIQILNYDAQGNLIKG